MSVVIDGTTGVTAPDFDGTINGVPLRPGVLDPENRIINGAFDFWQRGTSSSTFGAYVADRWRNEGVGGTGTMSRQSFTIGDTLGSSNPTYFLRQTVSGQSLSSHLAIIQQRVEGVRTYAGQTITILGWARRSSGSGNVVLEPEQSFGTGGSPSANVQMAAQTVTLTGSWAAFAITVAVPSITGKTLGTNNNDYLGLNFWTSAGSDFNARTNSLGLQTIGVDLWGVHIKVGTHTTAATDLYKQPEFGSELARCQRYYCQTIFNVRVVASGVSQYWENAIYWPQQMRAAPSTSLTTTGITNAAAYASSPSVYGCRAELVSSGSGGAFLLNAPVTADAEL